ncbi:MAG: cytidine deaminase [Pirellulaceae bacterium]
MNLPELSLDDAELVRAACEVRRHAYAPYSNFLVGAALRLRGGGVVTGVNVENASYGLTICAERVAISTAVASGAREFEALAVATPGGQSMCGACRQFAAEFGDFRVLLTDAEQPEKVTEHRLSELLPLGFRFTK